MAVILPSQSVPAGTLALEQSQTGMTLALKLTLIGTAPEPLGERASLTMREITTSLSTPTAILGPGDSKPEVAMAVASEQAHLFVKVS